MFRTYEAILNGDRLEWSNGGPETNRPVRVQVTVVDPILDETPEQRRARGKAMADALRRLAELGTFKEITDPVAWQREIRKDKPLYGREED
jgi:hypothetical protein